MTTGPVDARDALRRLAVDRFDAAGWRVLFDVLWPYVLSVCARLLGDDIEAAQDSAQETLIRLARFAPFGDLMEMEQLKAYARAVSRRVVRARYSRVSDRMTVELDDDALIASDANDPEQDASAKQLFESILSGLSLADQQLLRWVTAGMSLQDIAGQLGIGYDAAAVRVHRLRGRVRKWLQHI